MSHNSDDTICAISSPAGGAARGIIRISGRKRFRSQTAFSRAISVGRWQISPQRRPLVECCKSDEDLHLSVPCEAYVWPTTRSYTREPLVELHTIGSPAVLHAMTESLTASGARLAEPGEFTLRAFLAGRLDLTQAEAVLGVIDATNQDELQSALEQLAGGLAQPFKQVRDQLVQLLAELEAGLDFVEDDIRFISNEEILGRSSH